MQALYFTLAAIHLVVIAVTGMLWTIVDVNPRTQLRGHLWDIRAVHFGSLYLVPIFLGLTYAFERLQVPAVHQIFFPAGLGLLVFFSGIGYLFPLPPGTDPSRYWTKGWGLKFSLVGLAFLVAALFWTAGVLIIYSLLSH